MNVVSNYCPRPGLETEPEPELRDDEPELLLLLELEGEYVLELFSDLDDPENTG